VWNSAWNELREVVYLAAMVSGLSVIGVGFAVALVLGGCCLVMVKTVEGFGKRGFKRQRAQRDRQSRESGQRTQELQHRVLDDLAGLVCTRCLSGKGPANLTTVVLALPASMQQ
jgi:hypothetical protein